MAEIEMEKPVILPVEGKPLQWKNVEYYVHNTTLPLPRQVRLGPLSFDLPTNALHILHPNSGNLPPGSFMAILGSSGAGKTTFLNGLAQQYDDNGELRGSIHIGDQKLTKKKFSVFCGYVRQEDTLLPNCTVYETLMFYANLRLPSSMTRKERKQRVMMTMQKLGLVHCKDTLIGGKTRKGISGGEKRRVSIAVELIRNPTILFLDEPTSGLDSKTAMSVVENLVELAHLYNHSIVCTIHQPRSQIFNMFDYLMIMAKGKQIYYGRREQALPYFDGLGYYCPKHENPADYFIDLLTIDPTTKETTQESEERVQSLIKASAESPHIDESGGKADPAVGGRDGSAEDEDSVDDALVNKNDQGGANFFWQVLLLTHRTIKNNLRDTQQLIGRLTQSVLLAVLVIIIFYQIDLDQTSIQDRLSAVFMCLLGTAFSEAVAGGLVFPTERVVYQRERANRMYRISAYYIAKQISEVPLQIFTPLLFVCITYWAVGLRESFAAFVVFICIVLSLNFAVNSYGMLLGALLPAAICALVIPTILIVSLLAAGFYVNSENFPTWIAWIKYLSFFFYGFSAAIVNQLTDLDFYCRSDQYVEFSSTATCSSGVTIPVTTSACPITSGQQIIDRNNADELEIWQYILILLGFGLFFRLSIYVALRFVHPKEMELN